MDVTALCVGLWLEGFNVRVFERGVAVGCAVVMVVSGLAQAAAAAEPRRKIYVPPAPRVQPLDHVVKQKTVAAAPISNGLRGADSMPASTYPDPATKLITVGGPGSKPATSDVTGPGIPVTMSGLPGSTITRARVEVLDSQVARRAGISGAMLRVSAVEGMGNARLGVDYSSFAGLGGAGWSDRLGLVQYPECVLTTPDVESCSSGTELHSTDEPSLGHVEAEVRLAGAGSAGGSPAKSGKTSREPESAVATDPGVAAAGMSGGVVLAIQAGASGSTGDYGATSLSSSGSWSQGGSTGAFVWSYPLALPTPGTGKAPGLALNYNSAAVDGLNTTSNPQSSWVGSGWALNPGFVERTYRTCEDIPGIAESKKTTDLCWAGPVVTVSLPGGATGTVVKDDTTGEWRLEGDNGWRIQRREDATNGLWKGEYWVLTNRDGTKYHFGLNHLPGVSGDATDTHSALGVPVFSAKESDPCFDAAGFGQSKCDKNVGYRWNLDYVVDAHGNAVVYNYTKERNHYDSTAGGGAQDRLAYDRGSYLESARYGLHTDDGGGLEATAPQRVDFTVSERCFTTGSNGCADEDFKPENANSWPDVPIDQACTATDDCDALSPSFWTRKRLTAVTTKYLNNGNYQKLDSYALGQSFFANTDDELVLDTITRTGWKNGQSLALPPTQFGMEALPNRVEGLNGLPRMLRARISTIESESGQTTVVSFNGTSGQDGRAPGRCTVNSLPTSVTANAKLCYPVKWNAFDPETPTKDYFHKYVVTEITVRDRNGNAPARRTQYHYLGNPAWHYDDNEVMRPKYRTWGQFRGFEQVETRTGDPAHNAFAGGPDRLTATKTTYFRGMHGDRLTAGNNRDVQIQDSAGGVHTDRNAFAGRVLETQQFNGVGGGLISKTITAQTVVSTTATRQRDTDLQPLRASIVREDSSTTLTTKATGGTARTLTSSTYDNEGRLTKAETTADGAKTVCGTTSYAENPNTWVMDATTVEATYEGGCPGATGSKLLSKNEYYFDGSTTLGTVSKGALTTTKQFTDSVTPLIQRATYDPYGRPKTSTTEASPTDRTSTVTYTPAGLGAVERTTTTLPLSGHSSSQVVDPGRGHTLRAIDAAGAVTDIDYDALARRTAVWNPGQSKASGDPASVTYSYVVDPTRPLSVTTKTLVDPGAGATPGYATKIDLFDAFGTSRQTQVDAPGGGRAVTDSFTDSHGWTRKTYDGWYTLGAPQPQIILTNENAVDRKTLTAYDAAGRNTKTTSVDGLTSVDTLTIYGGDRTTTIPPAGATASTSIVNALGQQTELLEYKTRPTYDTTSGTVSGGVAVKQTQTFDGLGRQTTLTTAAGVTGQSATWTKTYDLAGRETSITSPSGGTTATTYLPTGEVKSTTDSMGRIVSYEYDALSRPLSKYTNKTSTPTAAPLKTATWVYDSLRVGFPTSSTKYTSDGKQYTTSVTGYTDTGLPTGNRVELAEDGFNPSYTSYQSWTSTGQLATTTTATSRSSTGGTGGSYPETLTYRYDALGNAASLVGENVYVQEANYSAFNEPSRYVFGVNNSTMTSIIERGPFRRISAMTLWGQLASPQLDKTEYYYDPAGNINRSINQQGNASVGPKQTQCHTYDELRQLIQSWSASTTSCTAPTVSNIGGPQPFWTKWSFRDDGSRATQTQPAYNTVTGTTTVAGKTIATAYQHPSATKPHQLASATTTTNGVATPTESLAFTYNPDGATATRVLGTGTTATTTAFNYDSEGTLSTVSATKSSVVKQSTYVRDADGNILLRKDPTSSSLYLNGQEVTVSTTKAVTVDRYYTFNGINIGIRANNGAVKYMVADLNGSNQVAVDPANNWTISRRNLDPYGNILKPKTGSPGILPGTHTYLNKPLNPNTQLVDMGARQYDPVTGQFLSLDPILVANNSRQTQSYTYSNNNPNTYADPTGLRPHINGEDCGAKCDKEEEQRGEDYGRDSPSLDSILDTPEAKEGIRRGIQNQMPLFDGTSVVPPVAALDNPEDYLCRGSECTQGLQTVLDTFIPGAIPGVNCHSALECGSAALPGPSLGGLRKLKSLDLGAEAVKGAANSARSAVQGSRVVSGRFPRNAGPDDILVRRGANGSVTNYQTYGPDGLPLKRVDVTGRSHGGVDTPHVVEFERHVNPATGEGFVRPRSMVRPATPEELMGLD